MKHFHNRRNPNAQNDMLFYIVILPLFEKKIKIFFLRVKVALYRQTAVFNQTAQVPLNPTVTLSPSIITGTSLSGEYLRNSL